MPQMMIQHPASHAEDAGPIYFSNRLRIADVRPSIYFSGDDFLSRTQARLRTAAASSAVRPRMIVTLRLLRRPAQRHRSDNQDKNCKDQNFH